MVQNQALEAALSPIICLCGLRKGSSRPDFPTKRQKTIVHGVLQKIEISSMREEFHF
jgi:hypothetical protein